MASGVQSVPLGAVALALSLWALGGPAGSPTRCMPDHGVAEEDASATVMTEFFTNGWPPELSPIRSLVPLAIHTLRAQGLHEAPDVGLVPRQLLFDTVMNEMSMDADVYCDADVINTLVDKMRDMARAHLDGWSDFRLRRIFAKVDSEVQAPRPRAASWTHSAVVPAGRFNSKARADAAARNLGRLAMSVLDGDNTSPAAPPPLTLQTQTESEMTKLFDQHLVVGVELFIGIVAALKYLLARSPPIAWCGRFFQHISGVADVLRDRVEPRGQDPDHSRTHGPGGLGHRSSRRGGRREDDGLDPEDIAPLESPLADDGPCPRNCEMCELSTRCRHWLPEREKRTINPCIGYPKGHPAMGQELRHLCQGCVMGLAARRGRPLEPALDDDPEDDEEQPDSGRDPGPQPSTPTDQQLGDRWWPGLPVAQWGTENDFPGSGKSASAKAHPLEVTLSLEEQILKAPTLILKASAGTATLSSLGSRKWSDRNRCCNISLTDDAILGERLSKTSSEWKSWQTMTMGISGAPWAR